MINFSISRVETQPNRETEKVAQPDIFGFGSPKNLVTRFTEPGPLTPKAIPTYKFPEKETNLALLALERKEPCYLVGHSGTGKTELITQIAAKLNYNLVIINFDGHLLRSDLIGEQTIRGKDEGMQFRYGLLPQAFMLPGTIICLDEVDAAAPETSFVMQRAVSESQQLLLHETNQIIDRHPQNCIFATANTKGQGDDCGLYNAGTNVQNFSFMNRFKMFIEVDYMSTDDEFKMLRGMHDPATLKDETIKAVCQVLAASRSAFRQNTLTQPLTIRDAINWLNKVVILRRPMLAARISFLTRMPERDAAAVAEHIYAQFQIKDDDDQRYASRTSKSKIV